MSQLPVPLLLEEEVAPLHRRRWRVSPEAVLGVNWLILAGGWIWVHFGWADLLTLSPDEMVVLAAAALVPPALLLLMAELRAEMGALAQTVRALSIQLDAFIYPSEAAESRAQAAGHGLRRQAESLTDASTDAVKRIEDATDRLTHALDASATVVETATKRATEAREGFGSLAEQLSSDSESLTGKIADLEATSARLSEAAVTAGETLSRQAETLTAPIEIAAIHLKEAAVEAAAILGREVKALTSSADLAREKIEGVGAALTPHVEGLRGFGADLKVIGEALGEGTAVVRDVAQEALQSLATVREGLDREAEHVRAVVRQSEIRIEELGEQLRLKVSEVERQSDRVGENLAEGLAAASAGYAELANNAEASRRASAAALETAKAAGASFGELDVAAERLGETLKSQTGDFVRSAEPALRRAQERLVEIEGQLATTTGGAEALAAEIAALAAATEEGREGGRALRQGLEGLTEAADKALEEIRTLGDRAMDIVGSISMAEASAVTAGALFEERATTIRRAVTELAEAVSKARDNATDVQRERFLKSATFIIETMHSIAVDLARILDAQVPDAVWKKFHGGDRSVFTRHLLQLQPRGSEAQIRRKFDEDGGFRDYVQRYLREFEGLLAQAKQCDHQDVLSAAFVTADVGKLYLILANAVGRLKP